MAFYGYTGDAGGCYWTPYYSNSTSSYYDLVPPQSSPTYSSYEFNEPNLIQYDAFKMKPEMYPHHYTYNFSEPQLIQFEPASCEIGYISSETTRYNISYSNQEFSVPELEEYDPTPYGGGYDSALVYGNPLPPSDKICYPRSEPRLLDSDGSFLEKFSYASIPSAYGKKDDGKEQGKSSSANEDVAGQSHLEDEDDQGEDDLDSSSDDHADNGRNLDEITDDGHENMRVQGGNLAYGSGLEAVDLCETMFGYWPCLAKMNRERDRNLSGAWGQEERDSDPWKSAAEYLFGSPFGYGEQREGGGSYGDSGYYNGGHNYFQHRY